MGNGASAAQHTQHGEHVSSRPSSKARKGSTKKRVKPVCDPEIVWSLLDRLVPDLSRESHESEFQQLMDSVGLVRVDSDTQLTEAGKPCGKLYQVQNGSVAVYVDDGSGDFTMRHPVSWLGPGDLCGEVSVLYNRPATARAIATTGSELLSLDGAALLPLLTTFPHSLVDWMLQMRYLWLDTEEEGRQWHCRLLMAVLHKVSAFHAWPRDLLETILTSADGLAPPWLLVSYPTEAPLVVEGDPPGDMRILVKGRVGVYRQGEYVTTVQAKKYPFAFGEEALFTDKSHVLSVVAETPCLVIQVTLDDLEDMKIQWGSSVEEALESTRNVWNDDVRSRQHELYDQYGHLLVTEMLYKTLRETDLFISCDPLVVQLVARLGIAEWCDEGEIFATDRDCLYLVLFGCLSPQYSDREELLLGVGKMAPGLSYKTLDFANDDRTDSHRRFKLQATQDTLVVKFQWNKIRDTLQNFSKEQLGVLSDVLQKQKTQEDQGEDAEDGVTMETFNDMALEDV